MDAALGAFNSCWCIGDVGDWISFFEPLDNGGGGGICGKFVVSLKLSANFASNKFSFTPEVFRSLLCKTFDFDFIGYADTGVEVWEILVDLSHVSKFWSPLANTCGEGEAMVFLGEGLCGKTSGRFCEDTLPFGLCRGATLVPSSLCICCLGATVVFWVDARFSLSNCGFGKFSNMGASDFYLKEKKTVWKIYIYKL